MNGDLQVAEVSGGVGVQSKLHNFGQSGREDNGGVKQDLMSIGIIIYMLLVGDAPFKGKSSRKILDEARVGYISFTHVHKHVSTEAKDFVKNLTGRANKGNSLEQFLRDPWLESCAKNSTKRSALSIDILDNLRSFNVLNQFEILLLLVSFEKKSNALLE